MKQFHHWISTSQHTFHCMRRFVFQANLIRIGCVVLSILSLSLLNSGCKSPTGLGPSTPDGPNVVKPFKVKFSPFDIQGWVGVASGDIVQASEQRPLTFAEYAPFYTTRPQDSTLLSLDTSGKTPTLSGKIVLTPSFINSSDAAKYYLQRIVITLDSMPIEGSYINLDNGSFKIFYRRDNSLSVIDSIDVRSSNNPRDSEVDFLAWKFTQSSDIGLQFHFLKQIRKNFIGNFRIFIRYGR